MADIDKKYYICDHCGHENAVEQVVLTTHSKADREALKAEVRAECAAEYAAELSSKDRQIKTKDIEIESLKEEKDDHIQSKIDLAVAQSNSAIDGKWRLKMQAVLNENNSLKENIETLNQKSAQGSIQAQGETGEILIETALRERFPADDIEEIRKGARGADCLMTVAMGSVSNSIFIESKVTKEFHSDWIGKLRRDMKDRGAVFGVIVSDAMPKNKPSAYLDGNVWVCRFHEYMPIVESLRLGLDEMNRLLISRGQSMSTAGELLDFLSSSRFATLIQDYLAPTGELLLQTQDERSAMEKQWKRREKIIKDMRLSTDIILAEFKAIAGDCLPEINSLPDINNLSNKES